MTKERTFDLKAEAALCAWEFLLDISMNNYAGPVDNKSVLKAFQDYGSVAMRFACIAMADAILDAYDAIGLDELESRRLETYDWEFVPSVVRQAKWEDWSGNGSPLPTLDIIVRTIRAECPIKN